MRVHDVLDQGPGEAHCLPGDVSFTFLASFYPLHISLSCNKGVRRDKGTLLQPRTNLSIQCQGQLSVTGPSGSWVGSACHSIGHGDPAELGSARGGGRVLGQHLEETWLQEVRAEWIPVKNNTTALTGTGSQLA